MKGQLSYWIWQSLNHIYFSFILLAESIKQWRRVWNQSFHWGAWQPCSESKARTRSLDLKGAPMTITVSHNWYLLLLVFQAGIHHYWWDFRLCNLFFFKSNPKGIHILSFWMVYAGCVLALALTCLNQKFQDLLSLCDGMHDKKSQDLLSLCDGMHDKKSQDLLSLCDGMHDKKSQDLLSLCDGMHACTD